MGLSKKQILDGDALFFRQLLLPMCDPEKSGIADNPRLPWYSAIEKWTAIYTATLGLYGAYGHNIETVALCKLLQFDMVINKSGVMGHVDGTIYRRWKKGDGAFSQDIYNHMTHSRWCQIKRCFKLCDNDKAPRRGQEGYDPVYKYDYAFKTVIKNLNAFTYKAVLDLYGDEMSMAHMGYGEAGSGLNSCIYNKPGITRRMQTVLICNAIRKRLRAYLHCHNLHLPFEDAATDKSKGWTRTRPNEVYSCCCFCSSFFSFISSHLFLLLGLENH